MKSTLQRYALTRLYFIHPPQLPEKCANLQVVARHVAMLAIHYQLY